jgi:23S rRNA (cytosine1962-C5)-methyltransferase
MKKVILKPGKEKPILQRHHWIFSGAIAHLPDCKTGELLAVTSHKNEMLGWGYFNPKTSLCGRMVSFGPQDPHLALEEAFKNALSLRKQLFDEKRTNAYRLINGEGDLIPGLILDRYDDALVMQVGSAGIELLKPFFVTVIKKYLPDCTALYEKSTLSTRSQEGLTDTTAFLFGNKEEVTILENGVKFLVQIVKGQKTGFFLDQREMRSLIGSYAHGKKVLNCFGYTGGFSLYAALNGAAQTATLDASKTALEIGERNFTLNGIDPAKHQFLCTDMLEYIKTAKLDYDLCILDPPAFAKREKDIPSASKAYRDLNYQVLEKMPASSLLLTCSCSYHIEESLFQTLIFQAALKAGRSVKVLSHLRQAADHPVNLFHPEGGYLKALLLYIS